MSLLYVKSRQGQGTESWGNPPTRRTCTRGARRDVKEQRNRQFRASGCTLPP